MAWNFVDVKCCQRRRLDAKLTFADVCRRTSHSVLHVLRSACRAVGAAGGGWALLATIHAALETTRSATHADSKCCSTEKSTSRACELREGVVVPDHIAVIMDGNRRYGRRERGSSLGGHQAGGEKLRDFVEWSVQLGVGVLTVFAFSTENWKRDADEVNGMMGLFLTEIPRLAEQTAALNVRVRFISSDPAPFPAEVKQAMEEIESRTADCNAMTLNICMGYGGRGDVVHACQTIAEEVAAGSLDPADIDERAISRRLLTHESPDPDVLIRTSGERRLSNFLMFQLAYTEIFFLEKHWPEVTREDLLEVVTAYNARGRRFGK